MAALAIVNALLESVVAIFACAYAELAIVSALLESGFATFSLPICRISDCQCIVTNLWSQYLP
jgi:energy-converting hydrogenase Eha subunit C